MSEIEKDEKVQALVKDVREQYNVHFTSEIFEDLEFRQLCLKEFSTVESFSKETLDDRDFAIKLVFSLIVEPKLSIDIFQKIPDSELISIIRKICDKNETLKKFFGDPEDNLVFRGFREAVKEYNNEKVNELSKAISGIGISNYQILSEALPKSVFPKINLPEMVLPEVDLQQIVFKFIIPQMSIIQSWVRLNEDIFANFSKQFSEFAESLKKRDLTTENVDRILKKYKWFISLSLPASFYVNVLKIEEAGVNKRKKINALFVDCFSEGNYKALEDLVLSIFIRYPSTSFNQIQPGDVVGTDFYADIIEPNEPYHVGSPQILWYLRTPVGYSSYLSFTPTEQQEQLDVVKFIAMTNSRRNEYVYTYGFDPTLRYVVNKDVMYDNGDLIIYAKGDLNG